jgi:tRNA G46 methylase TrmB
MLVRMWGKRNPHTLLVGMEASTTTLKTIWRLLKKLNIDLPHDPEIPLLGIYPKECN